MDLWNKLAKTDPNHTKQFTRAGGFKGTAVKPIYAIQKMTEAFGPCGDGWGYDAPIYQTVEGTGGEVLVYCTVGLWHTSHDGPRTFGVGGDFVIKRAKGELRNNDEAFKSAFTDALTNAMKSLGMSADVHMGQFDDSKYVNGLREEFDDTPKHPEQRPRTPEDQQDVEDATARWVDGKKEWLADAHTLQELEHRWEQLTKVPNWSKLQKQTPELYYDLVQAKSRHQTRLQGQAA